MEYIDERFPHPPLLPVYPVARAKSRLLMRRMKNDWLSLYDRIVENAGGVAEQARQALIESLTAVAPLFADKPFFMHDEILLVDCYILPLFWRLPSLEMDLPAAAAPLLEYADRMFDREGFQESLTEAELELR